METIEISDQAYKEIDSVSKQEGITHAKVVGIILKKLKEILSRDKRNQFFEDLAEGKIKFRDI